MTTSEPRSLKDWEAEHADRIVAAINQLRERYGWTIARLREELAPYGWTPSLETLNGILSAKKRKAFSVGEIFAFARALRVSPTYLITGLPLGAPLPEGPLLPEADVISAFSWVTDAELHIVGGSALGTFAKYANAMNYAKWHNALWMAGRPSRYLVDDLRDLAFRRRQWRSYAEQFNVPEVPDLPAELESLRLDEWVDTRDPDVDRGNSSEFGLPVGMDLDALLPLGESFSGQAWMMTARDYIDRMDAARAELDKLKARGERGEAADTPE
ncbi:helix-turn-helix transcriptional regulator [Microbacterium luteolum]|uniref:Helix-turn-helix transcriptional regulator n=1 Tax=Microbacterium luteolum TaxID=69367 RepID=A0ABY7XKB5_MICLT|nr:helix-turn-helix transcriptional regulator [Microbacterium luteolum]WDM42534.1 helix-turn-helix transcriptional regulator [Microbacterium luteolum]